MIDINTIELAFKRIPEYNQMALLDSLRQYQVVLADLIAQVESGNWESLEQSLILAQQLRNLYLP